ncbi:MAG: DHA2 family efflux MFS transporter permease subunit [Candidatus Bathyarchaeota archaeon]|nr:DHA2 family efflux MFS transporter permease subunit [Candidatus Bathyarchaeota archaeon]
MKTAIQSRHNQNNLALLVLCTVLFVIAVADTVLNLALPSISGNLGATATQLLWIVDIYLLVVAALQLAFGSIGDRYGRKRLLQTGLVIFGLGSLGAAFSTSADMLILFRSTTGVGAAIMMPSTLSILTDVFREPKERARAIAVWSSVFSLGAAFGPIIGGYLLGHFAWSSIFYLNLPIVAIGLVGSVLFLPESRDKNSPKPNLLSVILSTLGLMFLVYAIITAGECGWFSSNVLTSFGIAGLFLLGFVLWERRSANSLLPLSFFRNMSFTASLVALTLSTFALMSSILFFSQYLQSVQGYSPFITGISMLPLSVIVFITTLLSVKVNERIGAKLTISTGLSTAGCGLLFFSLTAATQNPYALTVIPLLLIAVGIGLVMSPATNAVMNSIPTSRAGIGSAMNDTTRQIGGALGIAVLGSIVNSTYLQQVTSSQTIAALPAHIAKAIYSSIQNAQIAAAQLSPDLAAEVINFTKQAFVDGLTHSVFTGALILFFAATTILLIFPSRTKTTKPHS